jgi:hypothetical protein
VSTRTRGDGNRLGETMAADGLLQTPEGRFFSAVLRAQKGHALARLRHRPLQLAPLALPLAVGLVQAPAAPHRLLAPVARLPKVGPLCDAPPVPGACSTSTPRASMRSSTWCGRSGYTPDQRTSLRMPSGGTWGLLQTDRQHRSPSYLTVGHRGRSYRKGPQRKTCDKTDGLA